MFAGVLVEFLAPAEDHPVLAGVLLSRGHEAQGAMVVRVVLGVDERARPLASALEIVKALQRKGRMLFRSA